MRYALFPFSSLGNAGGADLVTQLRQRPRRATSGFSNLALVEATVELLRELPWRIMVDHCVEERGNLQLAVVATDLGREIEKGDEVKAGFFLRHSESGGTAPMACERIYRVVCANGALVECERGQTTELSVRGDWKGELAGVMERCFAATGLDRDAAMFRATKDQMLLAPYEFLCNLVAERLISEDEQIDIQEEFDEVGDHTYYGIINAVTRIAGRLRDDDQWLRSMELERLGGQILRGDFPPPALVPAYC